MTWSKDSPSIDLDHWLVLVGSPKSYFSCEVGERHYQPFYYIIIYLYFCSHFRCYHVTCFVFFLLWVTWSRWSLFTSLIAQGSVIVCELLLTRGHLWMWGIVPFSKWISFGLNCGAVELSRAKRKDLDFLHLLHHAIMHLNLRVKIVWS